MLFEKGNCCTCQCIQFNIILHYVFVALETEDEIVVVLVGVTVFIFYDL